MYIYKIRCFKIIKIMKYYNNTQTFHKLKMYNLLIQIIKMYLYYKIMIKI